MESEAIESSGNKFCRIDFEPLGRRYEGRVATTLLEAAQEAGVGLTALCGGQGLCGRCKVRVVSGSVSPPAAAEEELLAPEELGRGYRLACQTEVRGDLKVEIPPESLTATQRTQIEGLELEVAPEPPVVACELHLTPPTLEDLRSDEERVRNYLSDAYGLKRVAFDFSLWRQMPESLRRQGWEGTIGLRGGEVISFHPMDTPLLGLAVDLGTTKIAGYLLDLPSGRVLAAQGLMNPQIGYGEDVMSRITYALGGEEKRVQLRDSAVQALNQLASQLMAQVDGQLRDILEAVVVGNTAMHHLFLGLPVAQLGRAPYVPAVSQALDVKARDAGLSIAPGGYLHLLPNIAGFVGADHVAMLLATRLFEARDPVLGLDIGTNTEITLAWDGRLVSCSCASGPAFEGAHIKDGMRAADGAIEGVQIIQGRVEYQTIGHHPPVGICGSGILDAVAQLLQEGIIDEKGSMKDHPGVRHTEKGPEFILVPKGEGGTDRDIVVSRRDVGEIQLAKGAISAGINTLLTETGVQPFDLGRVYVAGAFGTYINIESALAIGMFPPLPHERFSQVGNAAGMGARLALISKRERARAQELAQKVEYIELTTYPRFAEEFAKAMYLLRG